MSDRLSWLSCSPARTASQDFELEPGCTPGFTFTQGGAIMPRSLPLRWGKGEPPGRTFRREAAQLHNSR
jgi:hypothetical protein